MAPYLFSTRDPQGRSVYLTESCHNNHILLEHPDMMGIEEIERTITMPDHIAEDAIDAVRLVYYRTYRRQPQRWMLKVVVEEGEIITASRVSRLKAGETVIWRQ